MQVRQRLSILLVFAVGGPAMAGFLASCVLMAAAMGNDITLAPRAALAALFITPFAIGFALWTAFLPAVVTGAIGATTNDLIKSNWAWVSLMAIIGGSATYFLVNLPDHWGYELGARAALAALGAGTALICALYTRRTRRPLPADKPPWSIGRVFGFD
ncbi:hypothetical protein [Brevundimonas sp.]|uniref:hypothetical protein n=1 Tax=Brevundimonas sp. TaxID=1871086 RepID=UPI0035B396FA